MGHHWAAAAAAKHPGGPPLGGRLSTKSGSNGDANSLRRGCTASGLPLRDGTAACSPRHARVVGHPRRSSMQRASLYGIPRNTVVFIRDARRFGSARGAHTLCRVLVHRTVPSQRARASDPTSRTRGCRCAGVGVGPPSLSRRSSHGGAPGLQGWFNVSPVHGAVHD